MAALANEWAPDLEFLVAIQSDGEAEQLECLANAGLSNLTALVPRTLDWLAHDWPVAVGSAAELASHDVVVLNPERNEILVLYRATDTHHALLLTNRCNSYCLMCSQPPTKHDDAWLVEEAVQVARHIRTSPRSIGLSGGEPFLLGADLRRVIETVVALHPGTSVDVLTNGRLLSDRRIAEAVLSNLRGRVSWLVPLYGHADFLHDFTVQAPGAFEETIDGLLTLQAHGHAIQLRIVLIKPVLQILPELCRFIGRNLPFVREVAFMACEPIGFALANRSQSEVDLGEWHPELEQAASALARARVPFLFMNTPLCALPVSLRRHARQSISDWKRTFPKDCESCMGKEVCSGLFAWHERGWRPAHLQPISEAPQS